MTKKVRKTVSVLLNKNTRHLGNSGTLTTVRAGYARNFLMPQKIAEKATVGNIKLIQKKQEKFALENQKQEERLIQLKQTLESNTNLIIQKRVRDDETIFGNVTKKDIVDILKEQTSETFEKTMIDMPEMKNIGTYDVIIHLNKNILANIKISLLSQ